LGTTEKNITSTKSLAAQAGKISKKEETPLDKRIAAER
jgi:hypothetical protein